MCVTASAPARSSRSSTFWVHSIASPPCASSPACSRANARCAAFAAAACAAARRAS